MMRVRVALCIVVWLVPPYVHATPPTRDEIAQWCLDADGPAECARVIEARQLKRLPGLARRDGASLIVNLFPTGTTTFKDSTDGGGTAYSLWDTLDSINAVVLYVTRDDRTTFVVLQRNTGRQTDMATDPVLSPDRTHLATADFCAADCSNEVVVWRVTRDSIVREAVWKPQPAWADAAVRWKDDDTLVFDATLVGATESSVQQRKLGDSAWRRGPAP